MLIYPKVNLNRGYIHEEPLPDDYVFGSVSQVAGEILVASGNWKEYLPPLELQYGIYFDTWSCVTFSLMNCLEAIAKMKYGEDWNKSDRFTAIMSGTQPGRGNSLRGVVESARKVGLVNEADCPFNKNMTESQYFQAIAYSIQKLGIEWLRDYKIQYEWVGSGFNPIEVMDALKHSPLQTAVDAGSPSKNGIIQNIKPNGFNHAVMIYGYVENEKWLIYNSYDDCYQEFAWEYKFFTPLKISLLKLINSDMKINIFRNKDNGRIFLLDSDSVLHHIDTEATFKEFFGLTAWENKDWTESDTASLAHLREGEQITKGKGSLVKAILDAIKQFGSKLKK